MKTMPEQGISRRQLVGYGASQYHARALTQKLSILGKSDERANLYALSDVVQSIRKYLEKSRLQVESREKLACLLNVLLEQIGNVIHLPFAHGEVSELGQMTKQLMQSMAKTDRSLKKLKSQAAAIKGKYRK